MVARNRCIIVQLPNDYRAFRYRFLSRRYRPDGNSRSENATRVRGWTNRASLGFSFQEQMEEHAEVVTVGFELDGVKRVLDLRLNTDLIPVGYQQRHQHQGTYKVHTPSKVVSTIFANLSAASARNRRD